jgi:methyl-accepting chemotaxis protein
MDLNNAIQKHAEWKMRFRSAISRQEKIDMLMLADETACEIGGWLHGPAKRQYGQMKCYGDCLKVHSSFHAEALKIASAINAQKFAEAERMLNAGTPYAQVSSDLGVSILRLKKEAGI